MSLVEKLAKIISTIPNESRVSPSTQLSKVIKGSGVLQIVEELGEQIPLEISKEIIESGKKMVVTIKWGTELQSNQVIMSIRENSISFIGEGQNYIRLDGNDIGNRELIENATEKMFTNPTKI